MLNTVIFFFFNVLLIYFWLCWVFLTVGRLSLVVSRLLIAVATLPAEHGLWGTQASAVAAHGTQ